jgi:hypothetical protein
LTPHRGRLATGFLSTVPQPFYDAILTFRRAHPGWGQPPSRHRKRYSILYNSPQKMTGCGCLAAPHPVISQATCEQASPALHMRPTE